MNAIIELLRSFWRLFVWWVVIQPWEMGIRIRLGKRRTRLAPGLSFRIPYVDAVYRQSVRLRFTTLPPQTVTTQDGKTLTLAGVLGYSIENVDLLYDTLHQAEDGLRSLAQGAVAAYVHGHDLAECRPATIEERAADGLVLSRYGLSFYSLALTTYAQVRTYRIINDRLENIYEDLLNTRVSDVPARVP